MKKLLALMGLLAALCLPVSATTITASHLQQDASGILLPSGYLCATPTLNGQPEGFTVGSGVILPTAVCSTVTSGVLSSMTLADTSSAIPAIGYVLQVQTAGHQPLYTIGTAYPTGISWSLDSFSINVTTPAPTAGIFYGSSVPQTRCTAPSIFYTPTQTDECVNQVWVAETTTSTSSSSGSGSTRVVYASALVGNFGDAIVAQGSSTRGTDRTSLFQTAINPGNVHLVIDGQYGITQLVLPSNTEISCLPGTGLIQEGGSNIPMFENQHQNGATTASGTGYGYLVSNIQDQNIDLGGDGHCTFNASGQLKANPTTNLWTTTTRFLGIQNLHIAGLFVDAAAYSVLYSNVEKANIENVWCNYTSRLPNNDCVHANGPVDDVKVTNTRCTNDGDDCVAFNADDGNETRFGDVNAPYVQFPGFAQGPATNLTVDGIYNDGANIFRLLSVTEKIDNVEVRNVKGSSCNDAVTLSHEYPATYGYGAYGHIRFDGWDTAATGACSTSTRQATFYVGGNISSLDIEGLSVNQPTLTWPIIRFIDGTINNFRAGGWNITNTTGADASFFYSSGSTIGNFTIDGLTWADTASGNSGTLLYGPTVPNPVTISNFAGPNRLFATGFNPANKNGDAFTNSYPAPPVAGVFVCPTGSTCYMQTGFNEASAGTALAGTVPAITTTHNAWADIGSSWGYLSGGGATSNASNSAETGIDTGHANETIRALIVAGGFGPQIGFRYVDASHLLATNFRATGEADVYDVGTGGSADICAIAAGGDNSGNVVAVLNGSTITLTYNGQTCTGTTAGNTTGTTVVLDNFGGGVVFNVTGMSAASD